MSEIALINDTHWGVRNDSKEFRDYQIRFYREVFWPEIDRRDIRTIMHLGDVVDRRKYINFVTLKAMREEFFKQASERGIMMNVLVGNHDIPYRNTNEVNAINEVLYGAEDLWLYAEPKTITIDDCHILMMPWINSENYDACMQAIKDTPAQVCFGHLEIEGFQMYRGLINHEGLKESMFDKFDVVASGHFHHKSTKGNINYLGAPYEMTWHDYSDRRGFHIFDTDTRGLEYVENPLHIFHKVWYDDRDKNMEEMLYPNYKHLAGTHVKVIVEAKKDPIIFDAVMAEINDVKPLSVAVVDDHGHMDQLSEEDLMSNAEDTLTILSKYIKNLETNVDKNRLDNLLHSLYTEANDMESIDIE